MENLWDQLQNLTDAQSILSKGGFYFLLVVIFAETGLFFGFFLPGDYLLFMAGLLCSSGMIDVSLPTLLFSVMGAGILGNYTGYWFGYLTGPMLFKKDDSLFFKKRYIVIAEEFYQKHGGMSLVLGRFFPIIRTFAPIFAGVVKVEFKKFTVYNFAGGIAWTSTFILSGYFLGRRYPQLNDYLEYIILGLIAITSIPLVIAFIKRRRVKTDK